MRLSKPIQIIIFTITTILSTADAANINTGQTQMPPNIVYLQDIAPTIIQEMRYATHHNFVGGPLPGYLAQQCLLTQPTAIALKQIQTKLASQNLSLKVYDCYRPQQAVDAFIRWSKKWRDQTMKGEFYPKVNKRYVFRLGYVARKSGHSRASTVDLTLVRLPAAQQPHFELGQPLQPCFAPASVRFADNSIDMGTGYDCFDALSHPGNPDISQTAKKNRALLEGLMQTAGFIQSDTEWWHFTLTDEPYPNTYFDFTVKAKPERKA